MFVLRSFRKGSIGFNTVLGGPWDLVSKVISTLSGVMSNYKHSYLKYNPGY